MYRFRNGLLPLRLSSRLTDINNVINTINTAKRHTLTSLVCELQLTPQLSTQFHYLLALLGHIYCYTYEVLGPRVYLTMPGHFRQQSALDYLSDIQVMFEHKEYIQQLNYEEISLNRAVKCLPPVVKFTLSEYPIHQFPPFYPKIPNDSVPEYEETALGGTFDYLHPGHMLLLTSLALITKKRMHIALTKDNILGKKTFPELIQNYAVREQEILKALKHIAPHTPAKIFALGDPIGLAATEKDYEAIVLSTEVENMGQIINELRVKNGLKKMDTVLVDLVQLGTHKISSTDIRALINERCDYQAAELRKSWLATCATLMISEENASYWWTLLLTNYMRHDRYYHSLIQVARMLRIQALLNLSDHMGLTLGIWFHDIIYYSELKNSVENCAEMFERFRTTTGLVGYERVREYILATKGHQPKTNDWEELLLLDINLSILGSEPWEYAAYAESVKKEFSFTGGFEAGRRKVLRNFLARESIFRTPIFAKLFGEQARANIMSELSRLKIS